MHDKRLITAMIYAGYCANSHSLEVSFTAESCAVEAQDIIDETPNPEEENICTIGGKTCYYPKEIVTDNYDNNRNQVELGGTPVGREYASTIKARKLVKSVIPDLPAKRNSEED